jgi:DNA-directed RNA polymerase subunit RPC12/RpoP
MTDRASEIAHLKTAMRAFIPTRLQWEFVIRSLYRLIDLYELMERGGFEVVEVDGRPTLRAPEKSCTWTRDEYEDWTCSSCGGEWVTDEDPEGDYKYCPSCGSRIVKFERGNNADHL